MNKLTSCIAVLICAMGFGGSVQAQTQTSTCSGSEVGSFASTGPSGVCADAYPVTSSNPNGDCTAGGYLYNTENPSESVQCGESGTGSGCVNYYPCVPPQ